MRAFTEVSHLKPTQDPGEPRHEPAIFGIPRGRRVASLAASLALVVGVGGPLPTRPSPTPAELLKTVNIPHAGWGGECKIPGSQLILRESKIDSKGEMVPAVSVAECKPKGDGTHRYYNAGYIYNNPNPVSR